MNITINPFGPRTEARLWRLPSTPSKWKSGAFMQNPSMKDTAARAPRFYVDAALRAGGTCVLPEDAAHHAVHVLRVRAGDAITLRSEEHTSELQSRLHLVCRLLLEKKKDN